MRARLLVSTLFLALAADPALAKGKDKDKPPVEPPKTGVFDLPIPPTYVRMGVPKDYDAKRYYPLFFLLGPGAQKPNDWADAWSEELNKRGWIVAAPFLEGDYQNEGHVEPLKSALRRVMSTYRIDDRRVVIAGHISGANMAWRLAVVEPNLFAAVVGMNGGFANADQNLTKKLAGKPAFLFTGEKDTFYTPDQAKKDKAFLDFVKVPTTVEVRAGWGNDFSRETVPKVADWLGDVWPPGTYREKAKALEAAIAAKDFAAAQTALKELQADLKKTPYLAFEVRAAELSDRMLAAARALVEESKRFLAEEKPLVALERAEAAAKTLKGLKPVDAEATAALAALRKDPVVVAALARKKAEEQASSTMEKAEAAEAKGDLAKALDLYRRVVALGESSRKGDAEKKVAELEAKVGAGAGMETR
jgi:predicted esterase